MHVNPPPTPLYINGRYGGITDYRPRISVKKLNKSSGDDRDDSLVVKWSANQSTDELPITRNWLMRSSNLGSNISSHDCTKNTEK